MEKAVITGTLATTLSAEHEFGQPHLSNEGIGYEPSVLMPKVENRSIMDDLASFANVIWA
jgi:hypothetical protein